MRPRNGRLKAAIRVELREGETGAQVLQQTRDCRMSLQDYLTTTGRWSPVK